VVVCPEERTTGALHRDHGLPGNSGDVYPVGARQQRGGSRIHERTAVAISVDFIQTMCLRSWMDAGILKLPVTRAQAAADASAARAAQDTALAGDQVAAIAQIGIEQDDWYEEILDNGVVQMLNNQFEDLVFESEFTS
jgi:hypothetical protein